MRLRTPVLWVPVFLALTLLASPAAARDLVPTVTFVDGGGTIVSGARVFVAAPGVALRQCDIVRTGPKGLVQVEFEDGGTVVIGPDTRFAFGLPGTGAPAVGPQLLISGWAKLVVPKREAAPPHRIHTTQFDLAVDDGVAVLRHGDDGGQFFVERGSASALATGARSRPRVAVAAGQTYTRKADQDDGAVTNGADPTLVKDLPRPLRDTLPSRLAKLKARDVQAEPAADSERAEVDSWRRTVPELRPCQLDDSVRSAQETLLRAGHNVGPLDGILGPRTQSALRDFQLQHGLPRTGRLDAETLKALESVPRQ